MDEKHYSNGFFYNPKSWGENHASVGGAGKFLKWRWEKLFKGSHKIPTKEELPVKFPTILKDNSQIEGDITVTWLGHSSFLVQIKNSVNFLTDPIFSQRSSPLQFVGPKRISDSPIPVKGIPCKIHFVLISHNHYDHLDYNSCLELEKHSNPVFFVPLKLKSWFKSNVSKNVVEMDWCDQNKVFEGIKIHLVPAQHWSNRTLLDKNTTLWGGYIIEFLSNNKVTRKIYFVGDTGYSEKLFKMIGEKYGPIDLGFIPIGAYEPEYVMKPHHLNPEEAIRVAIDCRVKMSISMHHSTFLLTDEPVLQPREILKESLEKRNLDESFFRTLDIGDTKTIVFPTDDQKKKKESEEVEEEMEGEDDDA